MNTAIFYDVGYVVEVCSGGDCFSLQQQQLPLEPIFRHVLKAIRAAAKADANVQLGPIVLQRAYCDSARQHDSVLLNALGIALVPVVGEHATANAGHATNVGSAATTAVQLAVDAMDLMHSYSLHDCLQVFVLVAQNDSLAALAKRLREYGKVVIGCAIVPHHGLPVQAQARATRTPNNCLAFAAACNRFLSIPLQSQIPPTQSTPLPLPRLNGSTLGSRSAFVPVVPFANARNVPLLSDVEARNVLHSIEAYRSILAAGDCPRFRLPSSRQEWQAMLDWLVQRYPIKEASLTDLAQQMWAALSDNEHVVSTLDEMSATLATLAQVGLLVYQPSNGPLEDQRLSSRPGLHNSRETMLRFVKDAAHQKLSKVLGKGNTCTAVDTEILDSLFFHSSGLGPDQGGSPATKPTWLEAAASQPSRRESWTDIARNAAGNDVPLPSSDYVVLSKPTVSTVADHNELARTTRAALNRLLRILKGRGARVNDLTQTPTGIHLNIAHDMIYKTIPSLNLHQFGFVKFAHYMRWACRGTELCVVQILPSQIMLALRRAPPKGATILPDVQAQKVHCVETYRSLLSTKNWPPIQWPSSGMEFRAILDWLVQHPLKRVSFATAIQDMAAALHRQVSTVTITMTLTCFVSLGMFVREPEHARRKLALLSSKSTMQSTHDLLVAIKDEAHAKLFRMLGVVHQDVLDRLFDISDTCPLAAQDPQAGENSDLSQAIGESLPSAAVTTTQPTLDSSHQHVDGCPAHPTTPKLLDQQIAALSTDLLVAGDEQSSGVSPFPRQSSFAWDPWNCPMIAQVAAVTTNGSFSQLTDGNDAMAAVVETVVAAPTASIPPQDEEAILGRVREVLKGFLRDPQSRDELACRGLPMSAVEQSIGGILAAASTTSKGASSTCYAAEKFDEYMQRACKGTELCVARTLSSPPQTMVAWRRALPVGAQVLPDLETASPRKVDPPPRPEESSDTAQIGIAKTNSGPLTSIRALDTSLSYSTSPNASLSDLTSANSESSPTTQWPDCEPDTGTGMTGRAQEMETAVLSSAAPHALRLPAETKTLAAKNLEMKAEGAGFCCCDGALANAVNTQ